MRTVSHHNVFETYEQNKKRLLAAYGPQPTLFDEPLEQRFSPVQAWSKLYDLFSLELEERDNDEVRLDGQDKTSLQRPLYPSNLPGEGQFWLSQR